MVGKYGKNATDELKVKKVSLPRGGAALCCAAPSPYARHTHASRPDAPRAGAVLCALCTHHSHATYGHTCYGRTN